MTKVVPYLSIFHTRKYCLVKINMPIEPQNIEYLLFSYEHITLTEAAIHKCSAE